LRGLEKYQGKSDEACDGKAENTQLFKALLTTLESGVRLGRKLAGDRFGNCVEPEPAIAAIILLDPIFRSSIRAEHTSYYAFSITWVRYIGRHLSCATSLKCVEQAIY